MLSGVRHCLFGSRPAAAIASVALLYAIAVVIDNKSGRSVREAPAVRSDDPALAKDRLRLLRPRRT